MRNTTSLFFIVFLTMAGAQTNSLNVLYTGRTFGYYRVPDVQSKDTRECSENTLLPQVQAFLDYTAGVAEPKMLVGLGDNFSPDLNSRMISDTASEMRIPKEQLVWDNGWIAYDGISQWLNATLGAGGGTVPFDNVGCFFRLAKFTAIVPGKHDFHYGAERLRELARYLAAPARTRSENPVQMLAANITIASTVADPPDKVPNSTPPVNYAKSVKGASVDLPKIPLPYLRHFNIDKGVDLTTLLDGKQLRLTQEDVRATTGKSAHPERKFEHGWLCHGAQPAAFDPAPCSPLLMESTSTSTTLTFSLPEGYPLYPDAGSLYPGTDLYFCASKETSPGNMSKDNTLCSGTFQMRQPFFQYGSAPQGYSNPKAYAVVKNQNAVVFGIVDPAMMEQIGLFNSSWVNENPGLNTRIEIGDPHQALEQILQTCKVDLDCANARKILLAQMSPGRVRNLAPRLASRFEVIVSAADAANATGDIDITETTRPGGNPPPFVLTPGVHYAMAENSTSAAVNLDVTVQNARVQFAPRRTLQNTVHKYPVLVARDTYKGDETLSDLLTKASLVPKPASPVKAKSGQEPAEQDIVSIREQLQTAALNSMRIHCKADIAFLQLRDVYRPAFYGFRKTSPVTLQKLLDEVFWKGDLVICRSATGDVIKKVLAHSKELEAAEQDELQPSTESGRAVVSLGIFQNEDKDYFVGGVALDDKALYSIATTDYLALGDTGYSVLAPSPVPPARRLKDYPDLFELSAQLCNDLVGSLKGASADRNCRPKINTQEYLDYLSLSAPSIPRGLNIAERIADWARMNWKNVNLFAPVPPAETAAQNRRLLSIRLGKANLGFQQHLHSLSEALQKERFGAVQVPQATAHEEYDATLEWLFRITSSGKNADRFFQTDSSYKVAAIRQILTIDNGDGTKTTVPEEPFQINQSSNSMGFEAGYTTRLIPSKQKNITGLKLLTSGRFETEFFNPFLQLSAKDGLVKENLPRRNAIFGKLGFRYDGKKSYVEIGAQTGPYTQISTLSLGGKTCDPGKVADCIGTPAPAAADLRKLDFHSVTQRREQSGLFLNAVIHLPVLLQKFDYVIENHGNFYFNRHLDSAADTRYLNVITNSLTIPVVGNFSLEPKVDLFLFQNKVAGWHIHGYQTSITGKYSFQWHTGLRWGQVLRYKTP